MNKKIITIATLSLISISSPSFSTINHPFQIANNVVDDIKENISDDAITTKIKAKLLANPNTNSLKIHVKTKDGVVYLSGKVENLTAKDIAKDLAKDTKGVIRVDTSELKTS